MCQGTLACGAPRPCPLRFPASGKRLRSVLSQGCNEASYTKLIEALCAEHGVDLLKVPDGKTLDLSIPAGLEDGQTLRLKGQGEKGPGGAGDVYVEVKVKPHPLFERKGDDIYIETPITLKEAVLGGKITAPTIAGDVSVNVPKNSSSGTVLRLKGRGAPKKSGGAGDQYVKLKIVLPEGGDKELEEFVKTWKGADQKNRKDFAGA